ncbi:MAG: pyridine nucleotide-disulfide oxidoreductase, partial [Actinomycetota bacterium]
MTGISEKELESTNHDFDLGIVGFKYSDLFDAVKLRELAEKFYEELKQENALLHKSLTEYIETGGAAHEKRVESNILTDSAPYLSRFIGKMFGITKERGELEREIQEQSPLWKYKFFVQRRAGKKYPAEKVTELNEAELTEALREFKFAAFDETLVYDEELAIAFVTNKLVEAEESLTKNQEITAEIQETLNKISKAYDKLKEKTFGKVFERNIIEIEGVGEILQVKAVLQILEAWSAIQFHERKKKWYAFKIPHPLDYQNLVHLIHPEPKLHNIMRGRERDMRRRDGFKLTDERGTQRDALAEVDYCLICHERDKDSCSTGLREKDGAPKRNPLGIKTEGCPLDEKISEMHLLKRQGDSIGSLALVVIDNPMCAGTGHRICNDCMKGCIFQKQEPVNIPLAETATLT